MSSGFQHGSRPPWAALPAPVRLRVARADPACVVGARGVRAFVAGFVGLGAIAVSLAIAVPHAVLAGVAAADIVGILAGIAGIVLVAVAFRLAVRGRTLVVKLSVGILSAFVIAQWLVAPALNAGLATHAPRPAVAGAQTLGLPGARDVSFTARDGVRLSGWWVPGRSGAAVVLLHGSHNTRTDTVGYLRMLHDAGYGVLSYDARGHGRSAGQTNAFGWLGVEDVAGAVAFLEQQQGVDPGRIAALGLSMGAEGSLRAAAAGVPLAAVIADGAGASTLGDSELASDGVRPVFVSVGWLTMRAIELISGEREPPPLKDVVARVEAPVLLIASAGKGERAIGETYREQIGRRAALWVVPDAAHAQAFNQHPRAYIARVTEFLATALRRQ